MVLLNKFLILKGTHCLFIKCDLTKRTTVHGESTQSVSYINAATLRRQQNIAVKLVV